MTLERAPQAAADSPAGAGGPGELGLELDLVAARGNFRVEAAFGAAAGETLALVGPNGAGKSTLLAVLAGLLRPIRGRVRLAGRDLDLVERGLHRPPAERGVGLVFQDGLLFPHLSAIENVAFPLRARGRPAREARALARDWLERLGIGSRTEARPGALSGGEAQRVALARALVAEPRLLLLDEPLSALDLRARREIRGLIGEVLANFEGVSLLVTHDPVEALTLADRLVILEAGRVSQIGSPAELRDAPRTPYAAELVGLNLFQGHLEPEEPGVGTLITPQGRIAVAWPADIEGPSEGVIGLLRPADVSIHLHRPEGSARNVVPGRVRALSLHGDRARLALDSQPPLVAELTPGSVARLGLVEGLAVWASFKAVEVRVRRP